jgi:Zn-finger nucleic acid-binding protein
MSLKCSLFGHNYGETERRRNREENGTELVETTREIKACTRCGDTLVVSEATEVKTLQAPDATTGVGADTGQQDRTDANGRDGTGADQEGGTAQGGAETETADQRDRQSTEAGQREEQIKRINTRDTGRGDTSHSGEGTAQNGAATVGQGEAGSGVEPPDTDPPPGSRSGRSGVTSSGYAGDTDTADTADTRSRENSTTGTENTPVSRKNDAFIIDEDGEERRPTEWPGPEGGDGDDTPDVENWEPDVDTDDADTPPEPATRSTAGHTVPEGEFYCPECEFTTLVEFASSLREGDFCPECHRAALEHRTE